MRPSSIAALAAALAMFSVSAAQAADLSLFQNGNPNPYLGSTSGVVLIVNNVGPALGTTSTIVVVATLPIALTQMTASGSNWTCNVSQNKATCTHNPANITQNMTLDSIAISYRAQSTGTFQSCADLILGGPSGDTAPGNNHACFTIVVPPPQQGPTCVMNGSGPRLVSATGSASRQADALVKAQNNWSSAAAAFGPYTNWSRAQRAQTSCTNGFPATCSVTAQPCP